MKHYYHQVSSIIGKVLAQLKIIVSIVMVLIEHIYLSVIDNNVFMCQLIDATTGNLARGCCICLFKFNELLIVAFILFICFFPQGVLSR